MLQATGSNCKKLNMEKSNLEERIVELESRQAFQDNTIEELNGVIISHQQQLDQLESELTVLKRRIEESIITMNEAMSGNGP